MINSKQHTLNVIYDFNSLTLDNSIKALFLDLDNTCYEYEPCHRIAIEAVKEKLFDITGPISDFPTIYKEAQTKIKKLIPTQAASHSRILYFLAIFEILGRRDGHLHATYLEDHYWTVFISQMKIAPGLLPFLQKHKERGISVAIVSDLTLSIQLKKLTTLGLSQYVDFVVTSEEAGEEKPGASPFLLALQKTQTTAQSVVMIGDSREKDIAGAEALGIRTILFSYDRNNPI